VQTDLGNAGGRKAEYTPQESISAMYVVVVVTIIFFTSIFIFIITTIIIIIIIIIIIVVVLPIIIIIIIIIHIIIIIITPRIIRCHPQAGECGVQQEPGRHGPILQPDRSGDALLIRI
jgi:hypothetical protein